MTDRMEPQPGSEPPTTEWNLPTRIDGAVSVEWGVSGDPRLEPPPFPPATRVPRPTPRWRLPLYLFLATAVSTFWAGTCRGSMDGLLFLVAGPAAIAELVGAGWVDGLIYMGGVMSILLAHELGHYLQAVRYGIPASLPLFIPMPFTPLGTMGAVIAMRGSRADRRELFDIGLTGPWAGLIVALPVACWGVWRAKPDLAPHLQSVVYENPLLLQALLAWLRPELPAGTILQFDPLFHAAWVGMLVTGLNMVPISQLDGGHVSYALMGRRAHGLARGLWITAALYVVWTQTLGLVIMLALLFFLGIKHPPTANDRVPLGWVRLTLGWASLLIPLICFTPTPIRIPGE